MTVIRKAIIEIETRSKGGKLGADASASRAYKEEAAAIKEVERSHKESTRATTEHTRASQEFGLHTVRSYREAAHGVLQLARGIALLGASGEEDTRKLLENFVKIEAAVSILKGAGNVFKAASAFGLPGQVIAATTIALTAGAAAWRLYADEELRAARHAAEFRKQAQDAIAAGARERGELEERAARGAAVRGIDRDIAGLGKAPEQTKGLRGNIESIDRQLADAQKREAAARQRLEFFGDKTIAGGAERGRFLGPVEGAEREQLGLQKERVDIQRQIYDLEKQEVERRRKEALERISRSVGLPESKEQARRVTDTRFDQEIEHLDEIYAGTMQSLLKVMKDQQIQVNRLQEEMAQAKAAAESRGL